MWLRVYKVRVLFIVLTAVIVIISLYLCFLHQEIQHIQGKFKYSALQEYGNNTRFRWLYSGRELNLTRATSIENETFINIEEEDELHQKLYSDYKPIMTTEEKVSLLQTLEVFMAVCSKLNIPFFLYGGSLLGTYRHQGIIPWDDDLDVMLNASDKLKLKTVLSSMHPYGLFTGPIPGVWKFFQKKPHVTEKIQWPYMDIVFFDENSTHIWDDNLDSKNNRIYEKKDVFPLRYSLFEGALLPVPCNMLNVLTVNYPVDMCETNHLVHKTYSRQHEHLIRKEPCEKLHNLFPFVFRSTTSTGKVREELKFRGHVVHSEKRRR